MRKITVGLMLVGMVACNQGPDQAPTAAARGKAETHQDPCFGNCEARCGEPRGDFTMLEDERLVGNSLSRIQLASFDEPVSGTRYCSMSAESLRGLREQVALADRDEDPERMQPAQLPLGWGISVADWAQKEEPTRDGSVVRFEVGEGMRGRTDAVTARTKYAEAVLFRPYYLFNIPVQCEVKLSARFAVDLDSTQGWFAIGMRPLQVVNGEGILEPQPGAETPRCEGYHDPTCEEIEWTQVNVESTGIIIDQVRGSLREVAAPGWTWYRVTAEGTRPLEPPLGDIRHRAFAEGIVYSGAIAVYLKFGNVSRTGTTIVHLDELDLVLDCSSS